MWDDLSSVSTLSIWDNYCFGKCEAIFVLAGKTGLEHMFWFENETAGARRLRTSCGSGQNFAIATNFATTRSIDDRAMQPRIIYPGVSVYRGIIPRWPNPGGQTADEWPNAERSPETVELRATYFKSTTTSSYLLILQTSLLQRFQFLICQFILLLIATRSVVY